MEKNQLPKQLFSGYRGPYHVQGITVDTERKYIYYSFTTELIKTDLQGNLIGSVRGLLGHLGCITFCAEDGRVYGSLEYKHDCIGQGILRAQGTSGFVPEEAFYCAIFDVDKITREDMDAESDGIMTCVYLPDVVADYSAEWTANGTIAAHRYGCSGIDGISFGPAFGAPKNSKPYLNIAYGIYGETDRTDNDYQVLVHYDTSDWAAYEQPLNQHSMHRNGPSCTDKYFVYTGNTCFGVQNLAYDPYTETWLMCVYRGKKPQFPNYSLYFIDAAKAPQPLPLRGMQEEGQVLQLAELGTYHAESGIYGCQFPLGSTGVEPLGDGTYYFCQNGVENGCQTGTVFHYRFDKDNDQLFTPVE